MNKHRAFIVFTVFEIATLLSLLVYGSARLATETSTSIPAKRSLARQLALTDLAIWTEARYTRHPSQADSFAPFQDYPSSLEHFPAGSIVGPPDRLIAPDRAARSPGADER